MMLFYGLFYEKHQIYYYFFFNKTLKQTNKGSYFHSWGEEECGEQMGFYSFLRLTTISHNSLMDCF